MTADSKKATTKRGAKTASGQAAARKPEPAPKKAAAGAKRKPVVQKDDTALDNMIQERAYFIWESTGRVHGKDVEIWHQAKKEILSQLKKSS